MSSPVVSTGNGAAAVSSRIRPSVSKPPVSSIPEGTGRAGERTGAIHVLGGEIIHARTAGCSVCHSIG